MSRKREIKEGRAKCSGCKDWLDLDKFATTRGQPYSQCKNCNNAYQKKWRLSFTEEREERRLNTCMKWKFGITIEDYKRMSQEQNGVCAICGKPETILDPRRGILKRLVIDHDHDTGKIRGLLCHNCNSGIGMLQDKQEIVQKAADYLLKYKT